jgi:chemotaxis protein CheD
VKHIVGVADMKISEHQDDQLITYTLGSCLGITIYDPVAHVGGMLHVMLPLSTIDPSKAAENPWMFVDTGVPRLFLSCYKQRSDKKLESDVLTDVDVRKSKTYEHAQVLF